MECKLNCWEIKKCGLEPGGNKVSKFGVCPAAIETFADGIHDGVNAGRSCWVIPGTFCHDEKQGSFSDKIIECFKCDVYLQIRHEEGEEMVRPYTIMKKVKIF